MNLLPHLYPFLAVAFTGLLDANVKGRLMARHGWTNLPNFFRDTGRWVSYRNVILVPLFVGLCAGGVWLFSWRVGLATFVLGASGAESVVYWWTLGALGIKQRHHFEDGFRAPGRFEYPPLAPWLKALPPYWWGTITRRRVYLTSLAACILAAWITA